MQTDHADLLRPPEPDSEELFDLIESSMDGMRRVFVLREALRLGIFEQLEVFKAPEQLAREMGLDESMMGLFLEAIRSMGLLEADGGGKYRNSGMASTYLRRGSPYAQERSLRWTWKGMERWQDLHRYLHQGPETIERSSFFNDDWIHGIAERALCGTVQRVAQDLSEMIPMGGGKRLLDLGGGHGLYSIAFCARVPDLQAVVMDLPEVVPLTKGYIQRHGSRAVQVRAGDFTKDDLGRDFNFVFSSFNSSGSDPTMAPRVASALRPGGHLLLRQFSEKAKGEPLAGLEWNFVTIAGMQRGRRRFSGPNSCSLREYGEVLEDLGFEVLKHWTYDRTSEMMIARKRGE
jgi:precorrin-6B methylase 2